MEALIGVLTVSDTRTEATDLGGPAVINALEAVGFHRFERQIVPDEYDQIRAAVMNMSAHCAAVFTTGGTGFSPRDVTPEATASLVERQAEGLAELMRLRGMEHTPYSYLSRGVCGIIGSVLVVNLTGSPAGARQGIEAIGHLIEPILIALNGSPCPVPSGEGP